MKMTNENKEAPAPAKTRAEAGNRQAWFLGGAVSVFTFLVFLPALQCDFVNWDDTHYVYENTAIRFLDPEFLLWAFTAFINANWHPLVYISFALEYAVWGLEPLGFHLTNNVLHSLNALLVVVLISRLSILGGLEHKTALVVAGVSALLFSIHPLRVESVVWVTERKDVLYSLFYLLSIIAYLRYVSARHSSGGDGGKDRSQRRYYLGSIAFFALSVMSKPMAVTLPLVLLVLDYYPLRRFPGTPFPGIAYRVLIEKLPFIALSVVGGLLTLWANLSYGTLYSLERASLATRLLNSAHSYVLYLYKTVVPTNLAPLYTFPEVVSIFSPRYAATLALFILITALAVFSLNRLSLKWNRLFVALWAYYVASILPVSGLLQTGMQASADRFTYLASLAPSLLVTLGALACYRICGRRSLPVLAATGVAVILSLTLLTVKQTRVWKDTITLWTRQIELYPDKDHPGYFNRAIGYADAGDYLSAVTDFTVSMELNPEKVGPYLGRGNALSALGDHARAIEDLTRAVELDPENPDAYLDRGVALNRSGDIVGAIRDFTRVLELKPDDVRAYNNLGIAYTDLGSHAEALKYHSRAIELNPKYGPAFVNRGIAYALMGDHARAITDLTFAVELDPTIGDAFYNLALAQLNSGEVASAVRNFKKAEALGVEGAREELEKIGLADPADIADID